MDKQTELAEKTGRITDFLAAERLGGVLLTSQHNFSWLTGGGSNGIDLSREAGAGALLVRGDGRRFVLASRIEMPRLVAEELRGEDWQPVEFGWQEEKANPQFLAEQALALLPTGATLGADSGVGARARVVEGGLARLRYQLTEAELERYRALGHDAGQAIGALARQLQPETTEQEIARRARDVLAACGAYAVVTLVASDERLAQFRHPVPTTKRWKQVVMIVVCARRGGLIASLSRIVCAGAVPAELRRRTELAARVNARLVAATTPGASGRELYEVAAQAYADVGFAGEESLHHQGGATGYRTRDWVAHPQCEERVRERQAFAWNPSISGTKVEETCITTAAGVEVITASPGWETISITEGDREYRLPGVLSI